jgi:cell division septation protein DedD
MAAVLDPAAGGELRTEAPTDLAALEPTPPAAAPTLALPQDGAPVDLLSNAPPADAAPPPPTTAGAGYLVQLSAQRSMEQAQGSYADMQRRFPSVLGSLEPTIQQADLGEKGIYFRVRVGPWASRGEAAEVCEALKAAGGSCFVTQ